MAKFGWEDRMTIKSLTGRVGSNRHIARLLGVSQGTVRYHRRRQAAGTAHGRSGQQPVAARFHGAIDAYVSASGEYHEWTATIADVRMHGTTHERPIDRFERERQELIDTTAQPSFRLQAPAARIVAEDYLVNFQTDRYSVPFTLIGKPVELERRGDVLVIHHRGDPVATHPMLTGRHQLAIVPEHGPGAIARNARRIRATAARCWSSSCPDVEIRDLTVYDALMEAGR